MIIQFPNGTSLQAVVLAETQAGIRLVVRGMCDTVELTRINQDTWITTDCEPVRVCFEPAARTRQGPLAEDDSVCAPDLAAYLTGLLESPGEPAMLPGVVPASMGEETCDWTSVN